MSPLESNIGSYLLYRWRGWFLLTFWSRLYFLEFWNGLSILTTLNLQCPKLDLVSCNLLECLAPADLFGVDCSLWSSRVVILELMVHPNLLVREILFELLERIVPPRDLVWTVPPDPLESIIPPGVLKWIVPLDLLWC